MITIGDNLPEVALRTDEGTPLTLADLKGRALVLFLLGETFTPTVERLLDILTQKVSRFLSLDVSPIAVIGDSVDNLADYRGQNDVPFILLSDETMSLHSELQGSDSTGAIAWIVDKQGTVLDILPSLPPTELVALTVDRASRAVFANNAKRN